MEWTEYIDKLLSDSGSFDGITLSFDELRQSVAVPPIIKASILMLDRMQECQGKFNILVFPEKMQSIFMFTLVKLLYNISEGKIDKGYDPEAFHRGDKLRLGKAVVEFLGIEEQNKSKHMRIRLAESLEISAPIELFPLFQKTTAQKLSKHKVYSEEFKQRKALIGTSPEERYLKILSDYKTHMESSIMNMTSIINTKEQIANSRLCGRSIKDAILVGQADYEGNVKNIGAGQLGGIPAIVLASDLYAIEEAVRKGHPVQSIIIDGSNANALLSQMDVLDRLMRLGVPITCVTDIVNSFDLQPFLDRQFNLWRWDENSITGSLYDVDPITADLKAKHCAHRNVERMVTDGNEISQAVKLLCTHQKESQGMSAKMMKLYERLYALSFSALRETMPYQAEQLSQGRAALDACSLMLEDEKNFISPEMYNDFSTIIKSLRSVFNGKYKLPKTEALLSKLVSGNYKSVCLVVPDRADKAAIRDYWQGRCRMKGLRTQIYVLSPSEYYPAQCTQYSVTIVAGWLGKAVMRKILYSFNTQDYTVLLYDYENRWNRHASRKWNEALNPVHNRNTIEQSFATDTVHISTKRFVPATPDASDATDNDELKELETVIRDNKYRQYVANGGQKSSSETAEAYPINFTGGYLAFYRAGHKIVSATDIIMEDSDKIKIKLPNDIKLGDFVVVREADRDLIREMADVILSNSQKGDLRDLAGKWKEALEIEQLFYSPEEIYDHLQKAGCTKGYATVRSWLVDDDTIAPNDKADLEAIVKITGNGVLAELLDLVYDAAQTVRAAHQKAGRNLSQKLRTRIGEALKEYGDIDPFNIWNPIEMQIDGIGTVRILKVIDVGAPVVVDIADTNRLISEE